MSQIYWLWWRVADDTATGPLFAAGTNSAVVDGHTYAWCLVPGAWRAAAQEASHSPIGLSSWAHFVLFAGLGTVAFAQPLAWPGARVVLSAENKRQLWIPPGFAQGFLTLSDSAEFLYKTTDYWYPEDERCLLWNDTTVGIKWPLVQTPLLAAKDLSGKLIGEAEVFAD